ncbi:MAG TPA: hypothetical protein VGY13_12605 [Solirubrobacteraceae bacterium]|jgi:hypothetical protein|nr:hypothetical protein [Solirubrobacteraceae bacterium]
MADPFAERPAPWWKRRRAKSTKYAPKRQAVAAGGVGALTTFAMSGHHSLATSLLVASAIALPPALLEKWHKSRHRRREERLFVLPEPRPVRAGAARRAER